MTYLPTRYKGAYDVVGEGPPILCLAGFGCSNWIFEGMAEKLRHRYQLIMPDNRGMGRTPPASDPYSIEDLADDALGLMDALGIERFAVMGISMGGFIAQSLVSKAANRVTALMLLCATGPGPDFVPLPEVTEADLRQTYTMEPRDRVAYATTITTFPGFAERDPERFAWILERKLTYQADIEQLVLQSRAVNAYLAQELDFTAIDMPCLVLGGDSDRFVDPENSRILAAKIVGASLALVPQTDHLFFLEREDDVVALIEQFLEQQP